LAANRVAKWDGSSWSALGSGLYGWFRALAVYDDGSGPALYGGGRFTSAGGNLETTLRRWDGSNWSALPLGSSPNQEVRALVVYDDGAGPALYAGGDFTYISTSAAPVPANHIAKWDGSSWSALGSGMSRAFSPVAVYSLAVYDDGAGPALYAGGLFDTAGGVAANGIAKWDGSSWASLGSGTDSVVNALTVHDDGNGPALFAGGYISVVANSIAKWDGASWSGLGSAPSQVTDLASFDDGSGTALFAGGAFTSAGGVAANRIAKWDGSSWSPLGSGVSGIPHPAGYDIAKVSALIVHDDGGGPALHVGGDFTITDSHDSYLAKWGRSDSIPPVISCPPPILAPDRQFDGEEVVYFTVTATDEIDPAPLVACVPPSGSTFPLGTTIVTCTATDCSGKQSTCQFTVTVAPKARRR
jgi:hypothetical protein